MSLINKYSNQGIREVIDLESISVSIEQYIKEINDAVNDSDRLTIATKELELQQLVIDKISKDRELTETEKDIAVLSNNIITSSIGIQEEISKEELDASKTKDVLKHMYEATKNALKKAWEKILAFINLIGNKLSKSIETISARVKKNYLEVMSKLKKGKHTEEIVQDGVKKKVVKGDLYTAAQYIKNSRYVYDSVRNEIIKPSKILDEISKFKSVADVLNNASKNLWKTQSSAEISSLILELEKTITAKNGFYCPGKKDEILFIHLVKKEETVSEPEPVLELDGSTINRFLDSVADIDDRMVNKMRELSNTLIKLKQESEKNSEEANNIRLALTNSPFKENKELLDVQKKVEDWRIRFYQNMTRYIGIATKSATEQLKVLETLNRHL